MVNNELTQITNKFYENLETVDFFDTIDSSLVKRTNEVVELFEIGFSLESYTDELLDVNYQTLDDLAKVFKNISDTCLLSPQERFNILDNISDETEKHLTSTISGLIRKNIYNDEIINKQSNKTLDSISTSQSYL